MSSNTPASGTGSLSKLFHKGVDALSQRVPAVNEIQHTIRQQAATFNQPPETLPLHLLIKATSGVTQDASAIARESRVVAKAVATWGSQPGEGERVLVTTDRIGWLIFKQAELDDAFSKRVEQSRAGLKDIRNFHNSLLPRQQKATALRNKIEQYRVTHQKADKAGVAQLQAWTQELDQQDKEIATFTQSLEALKEQKIKESYSLYFSALRERAEKTAIVAKYGEALLAAAEFGDEAKCDLVRQHVETDLAAWSDHAGSTVLNEGAAPPPATGLNRANTRFKNTHAHELSQINTGYPSSQPFTPGPTDHPIQDQHSSSQHYTQVTGAPLSESAAIPSHVTASAPPPLPLRDPLVHPAVGTAAANPDIPEPVPAAWAGDVPLRAPPGPTLAETGAPIVGTGGPKSGQLATPSSVTSPSSLGQPQPSGNLPGPSGEVLPSYDEGLSRHEDRIRYEAADILARERDRKAA